MKAPGTKNDTVNSTTKPPPLPPFPFQQTKLENSYERQYKYKMNLQF